MERVKTWIAPHGFWKPDGKERTAQSLRTVFAWVGKNCPRVVLGIVTGTAFLALTVLLVKQAYLTRGEFAVGGEWLVLPAAGLYALIRWVDKKDREENNE